MDREWMYKQLDQVNRVLDVQTGLIEGLTDRLASLEECARVTPPRRRKSVVKVEKGNHADPF